MKTILLCLRNQVISNPVEADLTQCLQTALDKVQLSVAAPDSYVS